MELTDQSAANLALIELAALAPHASPPIDIDGLTLDLARPTPVYDLDGDEIFRRIPLRSTKLTGYMDVASQPFLGSPLLSVVTGTTWDESAILAGLDANGYRLATEEAHFIASRYPNLALALHRAHEDGEPRLRDIQTLATMETYETLAGDFYPSQLFSASDLWPPRLRARRAAAYFAVAGAVVARYGMVLAEAGPVAALRAFAPSSPLQVSAKHLPNCATSGESACFSPETEAEKPWCVAACVQMVLEYFGIAAPQDGLAGQLGLGPQNDPIFMPCGTEFKVITTIESQSQAKLHAEMNTCPITFWDAMVQEINSGRPAILMANGHARIVTGYNILHFGLDDGLRLLSLYDPEGHPVPFELYQNLNYAMLITCRPAR